MKSASQIWSDIVTKPGTSRAIALVLVSSVLAVTANVQIRFLSGKMHPFEIAFFRSLTALLIFVPLVSRGHIVRLFRTERLGLQLIRGVFQAASMLMFFLAISMIPLAEVSALGFSSPLFASLLAIIVLGEVVHGRRIVALVIGFLGTLVIVQPGWAPFEIGSGYALASSFLAGVSFVLIKVLSRTDSSMTTILFGTLVSAPVSLVAAIPFWTTPTLDDVIPLIGIGLTTSLANLCRAQALKETEMTVVAPFEFLKLPWTAVIGFMVFAEIPTIWTWIGGASIFISSTYLALRERKISRNLANNVKGR